MNKIEAILLILSVPTTLGLSVFFLYQLLECHRSPYGVFFGPINRREFKVLISLLSNAEMEHKKDFLLDESYIFDKKKFIFKHDSWRSLWRLNGVSLSYFQEKAILRIIKRKKLQAHLLTKAGQILFTKGNN